MTEKECWSLANFIKKEGNKIFESNERYNLYFSKDKIKYSVWFCDDKINGKELKNIAILLGNHNGYIECYNYDLLENRLIYSFKLDKKLEEKSRCNQLIKNIPKWYGESKNQN